MINVYGQKCLSLNGKPVSRASDFSETEPYLSEPQYLFVTSFGGSRDVRRRYWWQTPSVVNLQSDHDGWFHNNFTHFVSRGRQNKNVNNYPSHRHVSIVTPLPSVAADGVKVRKLCRSQVEPRFSGRSS